MQKRPTDKQIREIIFPVDPKDSTRTMHVGYCYGKRLKGEKTWRLIGMGENGQLEDRGRCSHEHVRQILGLLEHVRYRQSGIIYEGCGVIESFEFKTPPPTSADRFIAFVRHLYCWPALG